MDEPFSSLDADMRLEVREQVHGASSRRCTRPRSLSPTTRMRPFHGRPVGRVPAGPPGADRHAGGGLPGSSTRFVAEFMGDSDFLSGETAPDGIRTRARYAAAGGRAARRPPVEVALREDDVDFVPAETGNAVVRERFFRGAFNVYRLALDSGQVVHAFKTHTDNVPAGARARTSAQRAPALGVPRGAGGAGRAASYTSLTLAQHPSPNAPRDATCPVTERRGGQVWRLNRYTQRPGSDPGRAGTGPGL